MKDLIAKASQLKNRNPEDYKMSTHGTEDLAIFDAEAVPYADLCLSCKVPGGCDDTHILCSLREQTGKRADGDDVKGADAKEREFALIRQANAGRTLIPVAQDSLF